MNCYRLLDHTADMGIEAQGETQAELFRQMALGLGQIITACPAFSPLETVEVQVSGRDREELLVNWLTELVFLLESQNFMFVEIKIASVDDHNIQAQVLGERFNPKQHFLEREVKAVTYHQVCVIERKAGWSARIYVDL